MADPVEPDDPTGAAKRLSFIVEEEMAGQRADSVLADLCGTPRAQVRRWIDEGRVSVGGQPLLRPGRRMATGDHLEARPPEPVSTEVVPEPIPLGVLFEDAHVIVIDKPAGLVVHPAPGHWRGTLVNALLHHCHDLAGIGGVLRPGIVHRLDRGTSGVMVAAKDDATHTALSRQFQDHSIERIYRALTRALPAADSGRIDRAIGRHVRDRKRMSVHTRSGREAVTEWRVEERFPRAGAAWLEIRPRTGRTHQIRVHLASIGLPLAGDTVYGRAHRERGRRLPRLDRPALHAAVLGFTHPATGERLRFEAPLPADLERALETLRAGERPPG
jgi:23S rRNA pseudouridine1911/1915/1917 synthase